MHRYLVGCFLTTTLFLNTSIMGGASPPPSPDPAAPAAPVVVTPTPPVVTPAPVVQHHPVIATASNSSFQIMDADLDIPSQDEESRKNVRSGEVLATIKFEGTSVTLSFNDGTRLGGNVSSEGETQILRFDDGTRVSVTPGQPIVVQNVGNVLRANMPKGR